MASLKEVLRGLVDFDFKQLITPQIAGFALFLAVAVAVLEYVYNTIGALNSDPSLGLFYLLIIGPLSVLLAAMWYRLLLELAVVFFRILAMRKERAAILRQVAHRG